MTDISIDVSGMSVSFGGLKALDDVSFQVGAGEIVGLIGPNGSGKTTALNCLSGYLKPNFGLIKFKGKDITGLAPEIIANHGLMRTFQVTKIARRMTLIENMLAGSDIASSETLMSSVFRRRALMARLPGQVEHIRELLAAVKLSHLENEYAEVLSGGQQRLLSIALVLIRKPDVILLDEPAAGVHPDLAGELIEMINGIRKDTGTSFLIIEHNMQFIAEVCDNVVVLDAGKNLASGPPDLIHEDPKVLEVYLGKTQDA
uniref:ABC transporter ATP-binding protein n=1 Tax=Pararhizobium sp. IMCC3301 TaxID=3067904 RepID=UPI0027414E38|nr:ABC transporter ATP-binding protein [Pararhizobium sp. IMCC3301]